MDEYTRHHTVTFCGVSANGTLYDFRYNKLLKPAYETGKGLFVRYAAESKQKRYQVKLLVWETFCGEIAEDKKIYHKDFDFRNCGLDNLLELTQSEYLDYNARHLSMQGWHQHPKFTSYMANAQGSVMHALYRTLVQGSENADGYLTVSLYKKKSSILKHAFIFEAFHGEYDRKIFQIDHKNNVRKDNDIANLQKLTYAEHAQKTALNRPQHTRGKAIICIETGNEYQSIAEAALAFASSPKNFEWTRKQIAKVLSGSRDAYKGHSWRLVEVERLQGEVWKTITTDDIFDSISISSFGRIKLIRGRITRGAQSGEARVGVTNSCGVSKLFQVHYLVCRAFHGDPPSTWAEDRISVNHKNGKHDDNTASNLEWSNPMAQMAEHSNLKPVLAKGLADVDWLSFRSQTAAGKHYGICPTNVSRVCVLGGGSTKGVYFKMAT